MFKKVLYIFSFLFYVFFLLILFAHLLFPEKKGAYLFSELIEKNYGIDFNVQNLDLVFPFKIKINNLQISADKIKNLNIDEILVSPSLLNLLAGNLKLKINAKAFEGTLDCDLRFKLLNFSEKIYADLNFENINLSRTKAFFSPDLSLSGKAKGRIKIDYAQKKGDFSSLINFENFDFVSKFVLVPVSAFDISGAEIKGEMEDNNVLLKDCVLRSKSGLINFKGQISSIFNIRSAGADLTGKIIPDAEYILKNKDNPSMSVILPFVQNQKNLQFTIKGNLLNPMVRFK
jgi:type II secretion system protein N